MAGNNRIKFDVEFNVRQEQLKSLQTDLAKISAMFDNASKGQGPVALTNELRNASKVANELSGILAKSFNQDLGTVNVTKFNSLLNQSKLSLAQVKSTLETQGVVGAAAWNKISSAVLSTNLQIKQGNKLLNDMATTMTNTMKWGVASSILNTMTNSIKQAYNYSVQLDTSLNDIRIVTGDSADQMQRFAQEANNAAQRLGSTTLDYTKTALGFYQQGLGDEAVAERTEATIKAANVTGTQASQTAEYLTAVWNGFKAEIGSEVEYVDKLAAVADSSASNLAELATAMSKTASVANNMGVNMDQLTAQVATIIATTRQAPETVGNALKTIYARINDIKTGSDEAEVSLGNYTKIMAQLGYNVLDSTGHLRDTGEVMQEIGDNWANMTREQQIYLAQTMAGKRQMNNLVALFDNWAMYSDMLNTSLEAQGALDEKNNRYLESTRAHLNELKTATQDLYATLINNNEINTGIDTLTNLVTVLDNFLESFGGGMKSISAFGTLVAFVFREQIGKAIGDARVNQQKYEENLTNLQQKLDRVQLGDAAKIQGPLTKQDQAQAKGLQAELALEKQILAVREGLTSEEYNRLNALRQQIGDLVSQNELDRQKVQALTDEFDLVNATSNEIQEILNKDSEDNQLTKEQVNNLREALRLRQQMDSRETTITGNEVEINTTTQLAAQRQQAQAEVSAITSSLTLAVTAVGTIRSLITTLSDENTSAMEKLIQSFMTLGFAIPMVMSSVSSLSKAMKTLVIAQGLEDAGLIKNTANVLLNTGAKAKQTLTKEIDIVATLKSIPAHLGLAAAEQTEAIAATEAAVATNALLVPLWAIIGVAAAVGIAIYAIVKAYDAQAESAKKATQEAINAKDRAKEVQDAYENLQSSLEGIKNKETVLQSMTRGTQEWKEAVVDLNNEVLALLQQYPELAKYIDDTKGYLSISPEGQQAILDKQLQQAQQASSMALMSESVASNERMRADAQQLGRQVGIGGTQSDIDTILKAAELIETSADQLHGSLEDNAEWLSKQLDISPEQAARLLENTDALIQLNASAKSIQTTGESIVASIGESNADYRNSNYKDAIDTTVANAIDADSIKSRAESLRYVSGGQGTHSGYTVSELSAMYEELTGLVYDAEKMTQDELRMAVAEAQLHEEVANNMSNTVRAVEGLAESTTLSSAKTVEESKKIQQDLASFAGGEGGSLANLTQTQVKELMEQVENGDSAISQAIEKYATELGYDSPQKLIEALNTATEDYDKAINDIANRYADSSKSGVFKDIYANIIKGMQESGKEYSLADYQGVGDMLTAASLSAGGDTETLGKLGDLITNTGIDKLAEIDWNNITADELAKTLEELGVETNLSTEELNSFIDSMKTMGEAVSSPEENYKNLNEILDSVMSGENIDEEAAGKLTEAGLNVDDFFSKTLDGTYRLTASASEFKDVIESLTITPFLEEIDGLKDKESQLQGLYDTITSHEGEWGEGTESQKFMADTVSAFIDEQDVINGEELVSILEKIDAGEVVAKEEADKLGEAYSKVQGNLENIPEEIAKAREEQARLTEEILMAEERDSDVDTEAMENMADYLQENRENIEGLSEDLEEHDSIATDVAESILRFDDAIQDVTENYDDWMSALESGNIQDNAEAMEGLRDAYGDMLDIDGDALSSQFLNNTQNLEDMKAAAEGDIDAYNRLMEAAQQDIILQTGLDKTQFDADFNDLMNKYYEGQSLDDLEVGAALDDTGFLNGLSNMVNAANMTAAQAEAYLASMGVDAEVVTQNKPTQETKQQVGWNAEWEPAEATAQIPIVSGVGTEAQSIGSQTITFQSQSLRYSPNEEKVTTTQDNMGTSLKVIGAHKSSGGGIKFKNSSNGSGNGSRKGGGGGGGKKPKKGGGSKGKEYKPPKKKETKRDPYAKVNRQLKDAQRNLKELTQQEKKLTGEKYLKNLQKQNEELQKQLDYTKEKNKIAAEEVRRQQQALAKTGLSFDADGEIKNYLAMWNKYNNDLLALYAKATAKGATEADKARYEKAVEDFEKWEKQVADYNKDLDIFKDTYNEFNDIIDEMVENNIKSFNYTIDLKLDTTDFEKDWKKFKKDVLLDIKDDDYINLNKFGLSTMRDDLGAAKSALEHVKEMQKQLKASQKIQKLIEERDNPKTSAARRAAIAKEIEKLSSQTPYYDNVAQLEEDMKKYMEEAMKRGEDIADAVEDIHDNWMDAIDDAQEAFDNQLEQYESINELIEHNLDLVELLHGDEAYEEMSKLYDKQAENTLKAAADAKKQQDFWKQQMDSVERGSDAWNEYKKNWEDAVSETNKLTVESAKLFKEQYEAAIQGIGKALKDNLMGGDAYKNSRNWETMLDDSDRYLDTLDRGNNMLALYNKGQDMMMNRTAKQQKELQKLLNAQTANLENQTELRQIDFEIAQAELDLLEKRWALEDARNNKTKMRLRRDSQGNYRYQYVVDEDAVDKAQQEYLEAVANLREKTLEDYKDTTSLREEMFDEWRETMLEISEQYMGDEQKILEEQQKFTEEWMKRNEKLENDYAEMSARLTQINGTTFNALSEQMSDEQLQKAMGVADNIFELMKDLYQPGGELVSMVDGFAETIFQESYAQMPEQMKGVLQEATGLIPQVFGDLLSSDDWKTQIEKATANIGTEISNEFRDIERLQDAVNQNFDSLIDNLDSTVKLSKDFLSNQEDLNTVYKSQLDTLKQQETTAQNVLNMFRDAVVDNNFPSTVGQYINRNAGTANNEGYVDNDYADANGYDTLAGAIYAAASKAEGGNTGSWAGGKGKFAVLHADEYVLTEQDTKNVLNSINIAEALAQQISALQTGMLGNIGGAVNFSKIFGEEGNSSLFDQNVVINADFPAVESAREIKQAFDELVNMASQKVSKNRRVY